MSVRVWQAIQEVLHGEEMRSSHNLFWGIVYASMACVMVLSGIELAYGWRYTDTPMIECAWCHDTHDLQRHHPKPQNAFPWLANDPTNNPVIVFCRRCHLVLAHRGNFHTYNPDILEIVTKYTNSLPNVPNPLEYDRADKVDSEQPDDTIRDDKSP